MSQTAETTHEKAPYPHNRRWKLMANSAWNVLLVVATLIAAGGALAAGPRNAGNMLSAALPLALIGIPLALIMASGELDLSLGAVAGFAGLIAAGIAQGGGLVAAAGACMLAGLAIGVAHGLLVGTLRLNGALVTAATAVVLSGLALANSGGTGQVVQVQEGETGLLNAMAWVFVVVMLLVSIALITLTPLGRRPLPGDPAEPRLRRSLMVGLPFAIAGMMAGLAGAVIVARLQYAGPTLNTTLESQALLAVLIGGTPLGRGISNVFGALLGALFVAAVQNALLLMGIDTGVLLLVLGVIMVGALLLVHGYHAAIGWFYARRSKPEPAPEPPPAPEAPAAG